MEIQRAISNEIVLKEAEIFDNTTGRIEVPTSAIAITLADNNEVCFIIDTNQELLPCGLLEEAYLQLLRIVHSTPEEAAEKFNDIREEYIEQFGTEHAVFVGWINTEFQKFAPPELLVIIRQGVITGVSLPYAIPLPLHTVVNELIKYKNIKQYYIGAYEQIFILDDDWAFIYSDVNKFPPTFYKHAKIIDGKIEDFEKVYTYTGKGKMTLRLPAFIRDTFTKKAVKI